MVYGDCAQGRSQEHGGHRRNPSRQSRLLPFASEESAPIETEIIFRDLQSHLISVPVRGESLFEPGRAPRFAWRQSLASSRFTDLTRDGKRILVGLPQENANTPLILLLNWTETLRR